MLQDLQASDVVVLGLARGGVPVADRAARAMESPLDVIVVCKLGAPFQPELAMGAIGEDGARILNTDVITAVGVSEAQLAAVEARERGARAPSGVLLLWPSEDGPGRAGRLRRRRRHRDRSRRPEQPARWRGRSAWWRLCSECLWRRLPRLPSSPPRRTKRCASRLRGGFLPSGSGHRDFTQTSDEVVALLDKAAFDRQSKSVGRNEKRASGGAPPVRHCCTNLIGDSHRRQPLG